tara:strand:- start:32 stop:613 length:582 start_codon:yes stop_codon:yes gene_type:complete
MKKSLCTLFNETMMEHYSKPLQFHVKNGVGVDKNVFRPGSKGFFDLFIEVRKLHSEGKYMLNSNEEFYILETCIGDHDVFEGEEVPIDFPFVIEGLDEAKYKGREVTLGKKGAQRIGKGRGRVYVRDKKTGKVTKVEFGSPMSDAMGDSDEAKKRRKSFGKRHNCADKEDPTKPGYWSCRATKLFGRNIAGWW